MTTSDRLDAVERYIHELAIALAHLPAAEREDAIAGVREHIDTALAGVAEPDAEDVQRILDELGDPLVIAADTGPRPAAQPATTAVKTPTLLRDWVPAATVLSLTLGGLLFWLIVPALFWLVGLILLWMSPLWRVGEKVLGTFVLAIAPALLVSLSVFASFAVTEVCYEESSFGPECTSTGTPVIGLIITGLLVVSIVAVAILLWRRGASRVPRRSVDVTPEPIAVSQGEGR